MLLFPNDDEELFCPSPPALLGLEEESFGYVLANDGLSSLSNS